MASLYPVGTKVRELKRGRAGKIIQVNAEDPELPYKVLFADGETPDADWLKQQDLEATDWLKQCSVFHVYASLMDSAPGLHLEVYDAAMQESQEEPDPEAAARSKLEDVVFLSDCLENTRAVADMPRKELHLALLAAVKQHGSSGESMYRDCARAIQLMGIANRRRAS